MHSLPPTRLQRRSFRPSVPLPGPLHATVVPFTQDRIPERWTHPGGLSWGLLRVGFWEKTGTVVSRRKPETEHRADMVPESTTSFESRKLWYLAPCCLLHKWYLYFLPRPACCQGFSGCNASWVGVGGPILRIQREAKGRLKQKVFSRASVLFVFVVLVIGNIVSIVCSYHHD